MQQLSFAVTSVYDVPRTSTIVAPQSDITVEDASVQVWPNSPKCCQAVTQSKQTVQYKTHQADTSLIDKLRFYMLWFFFIIYVAASIVNA